MSSIPPNTPTGLRWLVTPQPEGSLKVEVKAGESAEGLLPALTIAPSADDVKLTSRKGESTETKGASRPMSWRGAMAATLISAFSGGLLGYGYRHDIDRVLQQVPAVAQRTDNPLIAKLLPPIIDEMDRFEEIRSRQDTDLAILAQGAQTETAFSEAHMKRLMQFVTQRTVLVRPEASTQGPHSMGAGWLMSEDGIIVTNAHVVRAEGMPLVPGIHPNGPPAQYVTVELSPDGARPSETLEGYVINVDPEADVAVIQLKTIGRKLPFLPISKVPVEQGDTVVSSGHALGFQWTTAVGRLVGDFKHPEIPQSYIQTDTHIGPGSSGGPLVNAKGEVVGMNTAVTNFTKTQVHVGLCLPGDFVMNRVADLRTSRPQRWMEQYMDALKKQAPDDFCPSQPGDPFAPLPKPRFEILPSPEPEIAPLPPGESSPWPKEPDPTPVLPRGESSPWPRTIPEPSPAPLWEPLPAPVEPKGGYTPWPKEPTPAPPRSRQFERNPAPTPRPLEDAPRWPEQEGPQIKRLPPTQEPIPAPQRPRRI